MRAVRISDVQEAESEEVFVIILVSRLFGATLQTGDSVSMRICGHAVRDRLVGSSSIHVDCKEQCTEARILLVDCSHEVDCVDEGRDVHLVEI